MAISVGIDVGTTAVKLSAIDGEGRVVFSSSSPHDLRSPHPGWAEEDCGDWWRGTVGLLKELAATVDPLMIAGIGCVGMVPTLICLDAQGRPLGPSIQQNDVRARQELADLSYRLDLEDFFTRSGQAPNSQHLFPKIAWLKRHQSGLFASCRHILGSYDYLAYRLTGELNVERNWALESGFWDLVAEDWMDDVLGLVGVDRELLPAVRHSTELVGRLLPEVAAETGLPQGIPVIAGSADHVASAFSTGAMGEGDLVLKLGGAGDILFCVDRPIRDPRLFLDYHCAGPGYLLNGCMAAGGSALKWFKSVFSSPDFEDMDQEAAALSPGSEGVVVLPYFLGEKTPIFDADARGVIYGLSLSHTRTHVYRAFLESVAFAFRHHLDVMAELGLKPRRAFITNGGSKSTLWRSILADVLGLDLRYVRNHPGSSLGAAILSGMATGVCDERMVEKFLEDSILVRHDPAAHQLYGGPYALYRSLYPSLKDRFEAGAMLAAGAATE